MNKENGFTLIEMLVVVAIIGLLSSVILTAVGPAKDKAKDTRIISDVNQIRSIAETLYANSNYSALESLPSNNIQNQNLKEISDDVIVQGGALTIIKSQPAPAKTYSVYSSLNIKVGDSNSPITQYYCVDSAGHSVITTEEPNSSVCPTN
jgi:prepilin-type N-terminal cleavage/methylation domain-containing protein